MMSYEDVFRHRLDIGLFNPLIELDILHYCALFSYVHNTISFCFSIVHNFTSENKSYQSTRENQSSA